MVLKGIDHFYYLIQNDHFTKTGHLYFPTVTPFILYFLSVLTVITGDPATAVEVGTVILYTSFVIALFLLAKYVTKNLWLGSVSSAICVFSGLHRYMVVEYVSWLGAVSFIVWAAYFGIRFFEDGKKIGNIVVSNLFLFLAVGSHKSALPIIGLLTVSAALAFWLVTSLREHNRPQMYAAIAIIAGIFLIPALIGIQPFIALSGDWRYEVSVVPMFPANGATFPDLLFLLIASLIFLVVLTFWKLYETGNTTTMVVAGAVVVFSLVVTLNPFVSSQFGFATIGGRLRILAYVQTAILAPIVIWILKEKLPKITWPGVVATGLFLVWSFLTPVPLGAQPEYLARRERLIDGLQSSLPLLEPNPLIVAAHGEQFVVTYVTGIPSQQSFPKDNYSVYWLLNLVPATFLDSSMHVIAKDKVGSYTVLVKDGAEFRARLQNPQVRQILRFGNRHLDIFLAEQGIP